MQQEKKIKKQENNIFFHFNYQVSTSMQDYEKHSITQPQMYPVPSLTKLW